MWVREVFTSETTVARPRGEVWATLVDWERAPSWMDGVERLVADGPVAAGTALTFTSGGRDRTSTIAGSDPGRRLVIRSLLRGITAEYVYELTDEAEGTRVTLVVRSRATGRHRVLHALVDDAMRRTDSGQPEALRRLLEDDPAA